MSIPPPPTLAQNFATFMRCLGQAVVAMMGGERLSLQVIALITTRIRETNQRFKRLIACLAAGTYRPRRYHGRKPAAPKPRPPNRLPYKFGWLLPLVPDAVGYRSQLEHLLRDPAMIALMAAAPAPMARTLRPLCWMLYLKPPPILARPRVQAESQRRKTPPRSQPPKARAAPAAQPARPAQPPPPAPPVPRACGPPLPD